MATPYYDPETDEYVHHVQPDYDDTYDPDDSDMATISSASTSRTTSTITSDEINGEFSCNLSKTNLKFIVQSIFVRHMAVFTPSTKIYL